MKNLVAITVCLFSSLAWGGYTVCSAPDLYYSSVRGDFGQPPPPGTKTGQLTIFGLNKILVNETYVSGGDGNAAPEYGVNFVGPKKNISKTGNQTAGSAIYKDTAVLTTLAPAEEKELLRTPVVCESTWAMVP